jgi:hypothetical protein
MWCGGRLKRGFKRPYSTRRHAGRHFPLLARRRPAGARQALIGPTLAGRQHPCVVLGGAAACPAVSTGGAPCARKPDSGLAAVGRPEVPPAGASL